MKVRMVTTVFFRVPDEHEEYEAFKARNDMAKWHDVSTSQYWAFTITHESEGDDT